MGAQDTTDAFFELLNADDRDGALRLVHLGQTAMKAMTPPGGEGSEAPGVRKSRPG